MRASALLLTATAAGLAACAARTPAMWLATAPGCAAYVPADTSPIHFRHQVTTGARPTSGRPRLAPGLPRGAAWAAAVAVTVDTAGRIEPCSVVPTGESHPGLARHLANGLSDLRFQPAWRDQRRVRSRDTIRVDGRAH